MCLPVFSNTFLLAIGTNSSNVATFNLMRGEEIRPIFHQHSSLATSALESLAPIATSAWRFHAGTLL